MGASGGWRAQFGTSNLGHASHEHDFLNGGTETEDIARVLQKTGRSCRACVPTSVVCEHTMRIADFADVRSACETNATQLPQRPDCPRIA